MHVLYMLSLCQPCHEKQIKEHKCKYNAVYPHNSCEVILWQTYQEAHVCACNIQAYILGAPAVIKPSNISGHGGAHVATVVSMHIPSSQSGSGTAWIY